MMCYLTGFRWIMAKPTRVYEVTRGVRVGRTCIVAGQAKCTGCVGVYLQV